MGERERYEQLKQTIDYHMDRYYNEDAPEISDFEYDSLMRELKETEREHPDWVTSDSPTQKIGGGTKREAGMEVVHHVPMLSIRDVFDTEEVVSWTEDVRRIHTDALFCVEEKIDGLSMSLRYQDGELILAETRGDGLIGEDVTENACVIPDVKQKIDIPGYIELRGEVYMSHEDFQAFNEEQGNLGKRPAANPRNLAAGTLRQLDPEVVRGRGLKMFIFNVQDARGNGMELTSSHAAGMDILREKGVPAVSHILCKNAQEVLEAIESIGEQREEFGYDIDGVVVKIDQIPYRQDFPAGSKYSSGHIAYKYPPEEREVVIDRIEVNVGRTGKMTFRAIFKSPVRLCGTDVRKATLHNADFIRKMGVSEGCRAVCRKQGDIIPAVVRVTQQADREYEEPTVCPVCGSRLVREEGSCDIYCENPSCPAQVSRTLSYFVSRDAFDIKNFGSRHIESLLKNGYIRDIPDIYRLADHREALIEGGILGKEKNTDRILASIEQSKENAPDRLLAGFAIRNVGRISAREIMNHYHSLWDLADATEEELAELPDIGEKTAHSIHTFFSDESHRDMLLQLENLGLNIAAKDAETDKNMQPLSGLTVVVTGALKHFDRRGIADFIEKNGGKTTERVSRKTNFLVAGENAGSKLDMAKDLGVPVLSEQEFMDFCKNELSFISGGSV